MSIQEADNAMPTSMRPIFTHVRGSYASKGLGEILPADTRVREQIIAAASLAEVSQIINSAISHRLSSITMLDPDSIHLAAPLIDYGRDSLTAAELKNWISKEMNASIQTSDILDEPSVRLLSMKVASRSRLVPKSPSECSYLEAINGDERLQVVKSDLSQRPLPFDEVSLCASITSST